MEGLRGFAVLLVFFVHYADLVRPWIAASPTLVALTHTLTMIGARGVDLFFVLSGYLIYGSLMARRQPFGSFLARRIQRIYPAFSAVFVLYIALSFAFPAKSEIPDAPLAAAIYLLQNYLLLPGLFPITPMITVAWSLSFELFYYLAIPLLMMAFKLRERSARWRTGFFLGLAALLAVATTGARLHLMMFIAGILLYEALENSRLRPSSSAGLVALVVGLLSTLLPVAEVLQVGILGVTLFIVCLACFGMPQAWLPAAFGWTPLRWLGNMSYSYYLLHGLALQAGFLVLSKIVPPTGQHTGLFWALVLPMLALTLLASAPLFLLIERPFSLAPRPKRDAPSLTHAASASESGS